MPNTATTTIFIDEYHPKADKKCAISIRITYNRKKKYYRTKFSMSEAEFKKMNGDRPRKELKETKLQLQSLEKKAADIIDDLPHFTFEAFERHFLQNRGLSSTVNYAFDEYVKQLRSEERIGTAASYDSAKISLNKFCVDEKILVETILNQTTGKQELRSNYTFAYITPAFLKKYEKWMLDAGRTSTTIGFFLRSLRTIFNIAVSDGKINKDLYPFGKKRYEIPASRSTKKALALADIASIYNYEPKPGTSEERAKDYWLFMYFCNGMNVKDMCLLKWKNIDQDFIEFDRAKTIRTKRVIEKIRVPLLDEAKAIIAKHGNKAINKEAYVFPVLGPGLSATRQRELIQLFTRLINDRMKDIAAAVGIKTNLTTYVARHTFSTVLKRSGASVEFISEALGHSNLKTTQDYLASFEDDKKKEVAKALTAFKTAG